MTDAKARNSKNGEQQRVMMSLKSMSKGKRKSHAIVEKGLASSMTNSSICFF